jgi:hypothetical protein
MSSQTASPSSQPQRTRDVQSCQPDETGLHHDDTAPTYNSQGAVFVVQLHPTNGVHFSRADRAGECPAGMLQRKHSDLNVMLKRRLMDSSVELQQRKFGTYQMSAIAFPEKGEPKDNGKHCLGSGMGECK